MKTLIVTLGIGKGTWGKVKRICNEEWDNILILGNQWANDTFKSDKSYEWITLDDQKDVCQLVDDISKELDNKELGEVYVNFLSGSGREHNAVLSALVKKNINYKMAVVCDDGLQYYGE